ncbi:MAG: Preprotein translocase Sec, Sec61-beta subunit [Candidatus Syntrophoarchaeum butanivorans]|uniref:Preprotein translocase subunit SecG n=2 Tax=Candidatus Syntropharchaeum butanivorans TaxID=1839936 RepID=A0A1F2P5E2_9EURY|nr:MAG: Preprotein translocase Sec, Sec61-beta subunit [Candidatus Syntrophoarchaeum butanivorans]
MRGSRGIMAKKKRSSGGLMSSAGLMRYFDTEETSITISPKTLMIFSIFLAVIVVALHIYFKTGTA